MNPDFITLKKKIVASLETELPGWPAQKIMAPASRHNTPSPHSLTNTESYHPSAVLICICPSKKENQPNKKNSENDWGLVMMKRTARDSDKHSAQISFPGGKFKPGDISLEQTALREFREETGCKLIPEIIGELSPVPIPVSQFVVTPFLSLMDTFPPLFPNPSEVEKIIHVPLFFLMDPSNRNYFKITENRVVPGWKFENEIIWGASAMMIEELCFLIKGFQFQ